MLHAREPKWGNSTPVCCTWKANNYAIESLNAGQMRSISHYAASETSTDLCDDYISIAVYNIKRLKEKLEEFKIKLFYYSD